MWCFCRNSFLQVKMNMKRKIPLKRVVRQKGSPSNAPPLIVTFEEQVRFIKAPEHCFFNFFLLLKKENVLTHPFKTRVTETRCYVCLASWNILVLRSQSLESHLLQSPETRRSPGQTRTRPGCPRHHHHRHHHQHGPQHNHHRHHHQRCISQTLTCPAPREDPPCWGKVSAQSHHLQQKGKTCCSSIKQMKSSPNDHNWQTCEHQERKNCQRKTCDHQERKNSIQKKYVIIKVGDSWSFTDWFRVSREGTWTSCSWEGGVEHC